jgi:hypothetical protein
MTIKKFVAGSMFSMLLGSEMAAADWGDVYYCQMTNFNEITLEGEEKKWKLEKFQFKLDQTKNAMVFGSKGHFGDKVSKLAKIANFPELEYWFANYGHPLLYSITYFREGKFLETSNNGRRITSISADCDKF